MKERNKRIGNHYSKMIGGVVVSLLMLFTVSLSYGNVFILNTISQTITKYDFNSQDINNSFAATGLYANKMVTTTDYLYLTNSGDNNVQKIDLNTGGTVKYIDVEEYANPYDVIIYENHLYVTGLLTNKVYKIDTFTNEVVDEVEVGIAPQGMLVVGDYLYVANSGFSYPEYFDGALSVIDLNEFSVTETIPVNLNPQRMVLDRFNRIHLVCTGDYNENKGSILVIDTSDHNVFAEISFDNYPMNIVIMPNDRVYVGDAFNAGVYGYDITSLDIVYDADNPLYAGSGSLYSFEDRYLVVADAHDFMSNSTINIFDLDDELEFSFSAAIGAVDITSAANTTSVDDYLITPQVAVYPNPSRDYFHIDLNSLQGVSFSKHQNYDRLSVDIYNIRGQLINTITTKTGSVVWNGKDYRNNSTSSGLYFIKISDRNSKHIVTERVMLIK